MSRFALVLGRSALALVFLISGLGKLANIAGTEGYMASKGMPLVGLFLAGAIALEVLGGLSLLLGYKARAGAVALVIFLIPATLIFHAFWAVSGPAQQGEMVNFLKNVGILGGLLLVAAHGAGPVSLDARQTAS